MTPEKHIHHQNLKAKIVLSLGIMSGICVYTHLRLYRRGKDRGSC